MNYKIIGYQFSVNDVSHVQIRKTLDIFVVFASAGGVLKFISIFVASFVGFFSMPILPSLLANRLYKWQTPETCTFLSENQKINTTAPLDYIVPDQDHTKIPIPHCYSLHKFLLQLCGKCRSKYWVKDYQNMLSVVKTDVNKQLNIVSQLRRMRAHGFAHSMMVDKGILQICVKNSKTKPLLKEVCSDKSHWDRYEQYTSREKFIVTITRKYIEICNREKLGVRLKAKAEKDEIRRCTQERCEALA